tara:strand:- start:3213 stop:3872 length:660 start_codon:yes stop_codon:yes gene_type:complete
MKNNIITIDGPSASGKGTLAKAISKEFNFHLLDSGLLYRAYAFLKLKGIDSLDLVNEIKNKFIFDASESETIIFYENIEITSEIRSEKIAKFASKISTFDKTRKDLLTIQRSFYKLPGLVADGRDMGTVVFPEAKIKIFLDASATERANRRFQELQNRGQEVNMRDLIVDIEKRDEMDKTRTLSPLVPSDEATIIDSSKMSPKEVLSFTKKLIKRKILK